jgi:hypothetical protein
MLAWLAAAMTVSTAAVLSQETSASARQRCRVPRLTGLTLRRAGVRVERAGCQLHTAGASVERASVQTVSRQSPAAGRRAASVTVWLNPICFGAALYPPAITEPRLTAGPTELVSGFFLVGGPLREFSSRHCSRPAPVSGAGRVVVTNASGIIVATQTSARGHLVKILLHPGTYTVSGTFKDASINGAHPKVTQQIVIRPGDTTRQDFLLNVP